jgi:hypothetical protein
MDTNVTMISNRPVFNAVLINNKISLCFQARSLHFVRFKLSRAKTLVTTEILDVQLPS